MERKTKIIATVGPSSINKIKELAKYVDVFRINLAHGDDNRRIDYIKRVKEEAPDVPILADLPGLKIRIGKLKEDKLFLKSGQRIVLGREIPVNPLLFKIINRDSYILISDGAVRVKILEVGEDYAEGIVETEGLISSGKGINIPNARLPFSMREEDIRLAKLAKDYGVDFIGLSYVTSREDIIKLREIVGNDLWIVAKIEMEVKDLEGIIETADAVMVARGDLGVQVGLERLPIIQNKIIRIARAYGRPVILATQVLESMVTSLQPTRAEIIDITNSVLSGVDAILLSDETAIGAYPIEAVRVLDSVIKSVEENFKIKKVPPIRSYDDAIAYAAVSAAKLSRASAILVFTRTGSTVLRIARLRPKVNVICFSNNYSLLRKLRMCWGIRTFEAKVNELTIHEIIGIMKKEALKRGLVKRGDLVVIVTGTLPGRTNLLEVEEID